MKQNIIKFDFKFHNSEFYISEKNELAYKITKKWPEWSSSIVYIYGPEKCGKSSICKIWQTSSNCVYVDKRNFLEEIHNQTDFDYIKSKNWVIDDVDFILHEKNRTYQEKILNLINITESSKNSYILMTAKKMPKLLNTNLKDLTSRISSSTVIEMRDPDEILLKRIIEKYLNQRNIKITEENLDYIICRIERSYKAALDIANLIDVKSLEKKRKINKNFLRSILI